MFLIDASIFWCKARVFATLGEGTAIYKGPVKAPELFKVVGGGTHMWKTVGVKLSKAAEDSLLGIFIIFAFACIRNAQKNMIVHSFFINLIYGQ